MLIYKVENLINGSCYIGQTVKSLEKRKLQHLCDVRNDSSYYLHRAIRKYGNENFKWSILCECLSKDDLNHPVPVSNVIEKVLLRININYYFYIRFKQDF